MSEKKAPELWEKRDDESDKEYSQFWEYAMMGPGRSIQKAYLKWCADNNRKPGTHRSTTWQKNSSKFNWVARAAAFDKRERTQEIESRETQRLNQIEQELANAAILQKKWLVMAEHIEPFKRSEPIEVNGEIVVYLEANMYEMQRLAIYADRVSRLTRRALGMPERITEQTQNVTVGGDAHMHIYLPELDDTES